VSKIAFVIPLKEFDIAKDRLRRGGVLDVAQLAMNLARGVLESCAPQPVYVASESLEVNFFATEHGARVLSSSATSLNEAVQHAYQALSADFDVIIVAHGDLLQPAGLGEFLPQPGVTIVTDHHGQGTNVLALPTKLDFHFGYGPESRVHHQQEAERLGLEYRVIKDSPWSYDVDEPGDLTGITQ
jgi:2-phospho-L-lactate guanylyltransferase